MWISITPPPQFWLLLVVVLAFTVDHAPAWVGSGLMSHVCYEVRDLARLSLPAHGKSNNNSHLHITLQTTQSFPIPKLT